ncbi:hypothetical protein SK128_004659 [Halocaridina rubra]|uniref:Alkylglycerol monooxygenase n=1 Tax=Halocaridina rubra TaxID=373956 RepID=A0AAN8WK18_HALRR
MVVLVDFGFYWFHRASHEIMILWAIHQVHHTSEDFSLAVGLRHSPLQRLFSWVFYLPLALLGIPSSYMLAHVQFNIVFQCWTHTEAIKTVGPMEYVFNTPAHHRVHHGCNVYCLDKNYGGIFIVWDRLFGTFQAKIPGEEIVYGIVFQPERFSPLYHQVFYVMGALKKAQSMPTWSESLSALVKGPSWTPGSPWTGWSHEKIDIKGPREHVPVTATSVMHCYVIIHFLAALSLTTYLAPTAAIGLTEVFIYSLMVVVTLSCIGILYERPPYARVLEVARCVISLALCVFFPPQSSTLLSVVSTVYLSSLILWGIVPGLLINSKFN